jgi:hypothetical protein
MATKFSHPNGVLPEGNILFQSQANKNIRNDGLGNLFRLTDQMIVESFLPYFDAMTLVKLSFLSKPCYIFVQVDSLWRDLVLLRTRGRNISFHKTWKDTYAMIQIQGKYPLPTITPIRVSHFYSHYLFHHWLCAHYEFERIAPGFYKNEDVPRVEASQLSIQQFIEQYEKPNTPVIITHAVDDWKALSAWNEEYFITESNNQLLRATSASAIMPSYWTMENYYSYAKQVKEEAPLYLFERSFASVSSLTKDYTVPRYFNPLSYSQEDLLKGKGYDTDMFRLLGDDNHRPDYKWLIIGPKKSGSLFHIDPNQTNAWNVAIQGRKKWIFYPPTVQPPAVQSSADGADVTVPVSTAEWLINFWSFHQESRYHKDPAKRPLEAILQPGELMFVPHGWWHMVINLDFTVALTHNYVSTSNLKDCLQFLKHKKEQISGIREGTAAAPPDRLYEEFRGKLETHLPKELFEKYMKQLENNHNNNNNSRNNINQSNCSSVLSSGTAGKKNNAKRKHRSADQDQANHEPEAHNNPSEDGSSEDDERKKQKNTNNDDEKNNIWGCSFSVAKEEEDSSAFGSNSLFKFGFSVE